MNYSVKQMSFDKDIYEIAIGGVHNGYYRHSDCTISLSFTCIPLSTLNGIISEIQKIKD